MKVSVVLATYNGEKYIIDQLESLRNQTYTIDEVLVYDDFSKDKTVQVIKNYIKKYNLQNWVCKINNSNVGWKKNFKQLLDCASGDIVFLCDQDDIWNENKIKKMTNIMQQNEKINVLACGYNIKYETSDIKKVNSSVINQMNETSRVYPYTFNLNFLEVKRPGCTYAINKKFWKKISYFWDERLPHDYFIWAISILSNSLFILDENLIDWRRFSNSATAFSESKFQDKIKKNINNRLTSLELDNFFINKITKTKSILKYSSEEKIEKLYVIQKNNEQIINYYKRASFFKYVSFFLSTKNKFYRYKTCVGDMLYILFLKFNRTNIEMKL